MNVTQVQMQNFMRHDSFSLVLPETGTVLVTGLNGCLHGDTPIYDPVDRTEATVRERCERKIPFHVYAMGADGPVITAALPPVRYAQEAMLVVTTEAGSVTVTPNHRFWTGETWVTAACVYAKQQQAAGGLLVTNLDSAQLARAPDALRWTQTTLDSQVDYPADYHLHGEPPRWAQDTAPIPAPSQGDAHVHNQRGFDAGGPASATGRSHNAHGSNADQDSTDVQGSNVACVTSVLSVAPDVYYDFHVPHFQNYWACGMWHHNSGKSTLMESVAWCCWGRTLRGSKPWREGQVCSVTVTTPNLTITRQRSKGGTNKLLWKYTDATATDFDTATKGQAALDKVIGAFDVWRKTHVLTNADAAQFTEATDSERKRLLEEVLGIDKIDAAKERARLDAAGAEIALDRVTTSVAQRAITLKTTAQTLLALPVAVADPPPAVDAKALAAMVRAAKAARQASNDLEKSVYDGVRAKRGTLQELKRRLDRLGVSECPVCSQAITDALRAPLEAQVLAEDAAVQALQAQAEIEAARVRDECAEADEEYIALVASEKTLAQQLALHAQQAKLVKESAAQRARLQVIINTCEKELASAKELLPAQQRRVACLKAVQIAFGMKGFRAQLLSDAILGVEAFTNTWLQIIAPDLSVKLSLGEKHEVKLDLIGAGGGFGYQALSSGERRRIDVAVVLALADMASQATGIGAGTLWLDEVFDSLDPVGTQGVCEALLVLSESRVAVVITHSDELRSQVDTQMSVTL